MNLIQYIPSLGITSRPKCMDDEYKLENVIDSYRNYYIHGKSHLHVWKNREKPYWI